MFIPILTRPQLKIISNVFCNLAVVWLIALLATQNILVLTGNIIAVIVSLRVALVAEKQLEKYD